MVKRKGVGYIIEGMAALLIMFVFILGNTPTEPQTDWSNFQKEVIAQDLSYVLEESGDSEDFIRNGETGTLVTAGSELSNERVEVSGTVENVPITTQVIGFHTRENDRVNVSLTEVDSGDTCYNDLEEVNTEDGAEKLKGERNGVTVYVSDTDPDISGGDGNVDYDTLWVDNGTRCQFSASEGPYYIDEFFYLSDGSGGNHYDINDIYDSDRELEIFDASQVVDLKDTLDQRMNGIDTGSVADTVAAERENLDSYDILVFRRDDSLDLLNSNREKIQEFMSTGSVMLLMDLEKEDFYSDLGDSPEVRDNFITSTGLKWIGLGWETSPSNPPEASFSSNPESERLQTFFRGLRGQSEDVNLQPGGNISSSNSRQFRSLPPFLSTTIGLYSITDWNATNYTMEEVDSDTVIGVPETACTNDNTVTRGVFEFHDYQTDSFVEKEIISTELGESQSFCDNRDVRALNIDIDGNGDYSDSGEGPFLNGEKVIVENKTYVVNFPSEEALETGDTAELVYTGDSSIENINYRTSFQGFDGQRLARMEYESDYSEEEEKIIAAVVHWLSDDTTQFGTPEDSEISTETIAGVKEETFVPYKISMRWQ